MPTPFNPFRRLFAWFQTRRKMLETIHQQNEIHDALTAQLADARAAVDAGGRIRDALRCQLTATQAQLTEVIDEANVSLGRIEAQAAQIASLQHALEQCEKDRDEWRREAEALGKEAESASDERDETVKQRDAAAQTVDRLSRSINEVLDVFRRSDLI